MGNCFTVKLLCRESKKKVVLLLLGLEGAGKTTVAKGLAGELENGVVPTVGFSTVSLAYKKFTVVLYDLGGGPGIRAIWENYFADAHGIIYVLDSVNTSKFNECREILMSILSNDKLTGKPLLVLGNKQDIPGALDEIDIVEMLDLENLVNQQKCPTLVETCSAITLQKPRTKEDPVIQNSFKWLLSLIERDFEQLNSRVEQDMTLQKEINEVEMKAKLQRIAESKELNSLPETPETQNGQMEGPGKTDGEISTNLITSCGNLIDDNPVHGSSSLGKRTRGSKHRCSNSKRRVLHWFCLCPSTGQVSEPSMSPRKCCVAARRKFCFWRYRRTAPFPLKEEGNGIGHSVVPVWAVRLPPEQGIGVTPNPLPPPSIGHSQPETTFELEEFAGIRHPNRPSPLQVMKG